MQNFGFDGPLEDNCEIIVIPNAPLNEKPILFLVNPKSGREKALSIFNRKVLPILQRSNSKYDMIVTNRQNHARDFISTEDIKQWKAIVIISGDGLVHEVINGLFLREDWQDACKTLIGVIPGGSGNGLAKSISFSQTEDDETMTDIEKTTLRMIRCSSSPMDLVCVEMEQGKLYSFLSVGWGFLCDVDIESERFRWMGEFRFTVQTLLRLANLRFYRGRLSYLEAEDFKHPNKVEVFEKLKVQTEKIEIPKLSESLPPEWTVVEDDFLLIYAVYQSHISSSMFCSPYSKLSDGLMFLFTIRKSAFPVRTSWRSRWTMLKFLLKMEAGSGEHVNMPGIEMIPVRGFRLEPLEDRGYMTVDGELVKLGIMQASVMPSVARIVS
eukprot:GFUD01004450.1.p1 GENE.GFUD01004450.1~~GFUD01004450.1.p1  ORF type:complete len:382 (+),score=76.64 GFUD01004450.1:72-1217(+)